VVEMVVCFDNSNTGDNDGQHWCPRSTSGEHAAVGVVRCDRHGFLLWRLPYTPSVYDCNSGY
jgi:hypothetical protein